jgi:hypothetical protein
MVPHYCLFQLQMWNIWHGNIIVKIPIKLKMDLSISFAVFLALLYLLDYIWTEYFQFAELPTSAHVPTILFRGGGGGSCSKFL